MAEFTTEGDVSINEGEEALIFFSFSLPPSLMCNSTDISGDNLCQIHISATVELSADVSCMDGSTIPQALIGYYSEYDEATLNTCGLKVTDDNWFQEFLIPVVATVDRQKDGDQTRHLYLYQQLVLVSVTQTITVLYEEEVDDLEVSV